ncbi:hypothetical protein [Lysobacter gummosus]|uniref:hypothetical protein n=1 Tax=Lysobacter gummosus TaxID=262324 RepID=UPI00362D3083
MKRPQRECRRGCVVAVAVRCGRDQPGRWIKVANEFRDRRTPISSRRNTRSKPGRWRSTPRRATSRRCCRPG